MSVNPEIAKQQIAKLVNKYGCVPTDAPDGPVITEFQADALGKAIEQEIARAHDYGWTKITLHMDMPDAFKLARYLRRK
jgi:histidyl-tRNA synthetase